MTYPLQALCIDLDGTLADSLEVMFRAYNTFLGHYGHTGSYEEFESLNGPSLPEIVAILQERYHIGGPIESLIKPIYKITAMEYMKVHLFPGSREFLTAAKAAGLRLAIVTSSMAALVLPFLQAQGIHDLFDIIVTSDGLTRSKPDPAIYHLALERLALSPSDVIAIEDGTHGITAARAAGIRAIQMCHHGHGTATTEPVLAIATSWGEVQQALLGGGQVARL